MKMKMPDTAALAADLPKTFWNKVLTATPIAMTVVATALAALSTGEMGKAQYARSLAAQLQSKAGDQWGFFQAKRLRGATAKNTADLLQATVSVGRFDPAAVVAALPPAAATTPLLSPTNAALGLISAGRLPELAPAPRPVAPIEAALAAVAAGKSDREIEQLTLSIKAADLAAAVTAARERGHALDEALAPVNNALDQLELFIAAAVAVGPPSAALQEQARNFTALRLRHAAMRYDAEAKLNRVVAELYELQVRQGNAVSDRHRARSQKFFYGMLGAQVAVIVATFALAVQRRNLLWGLAAAAGLTAATFGAYVYLFN